MIRSKLNKKKIIKTAIISFTVLLCVFTLLFIILRFIYPLILREVNKIKAPGIDLMETVEINGIKQVLYFRGENIENPIVLFIHGGPGSPMIPLLHGFQYDLEKDFTIVHWEQRNAGKTFYLNNPDAVLETMTFEIMLTDAHEITQYIKQKLNKDEIIILAYSWGTVLGTALAQEYPQDYSAYIGVGQIISTTEDRIIGYEAVLEAAHEKGNKRDIQALEQLDPNINEHFWEIRPYLNKYNLAEDLSLRLIMRAFTSPYYGLKDLMYYLNVNILYYQEPIFSFLNNFEIRDWNTHYEIPVFYIMGERDYTTPYSLAKEFFEEISAANKEFFSIPDAGHIPMLDNKNEFNRIILEVISSLLINE